MQILGVSFHDLHDVHRRISDHISGSISLFGEGAVFVGDTLLSASIGRTDLPGSSFAMTIYPTKNRPMRLPDHAKVYPGHGSRQPLAMRGGAIQFYAIFF